MYILYLCFICFAHLVFFRGQSSFCCIVASDVRYEPTVLSASAVCCRIYAPLQHDIVLGSFLIWLVVNCMLDLHLFLFYYSLCPKAKLHWYRLCWHVVAVVDVVRSMLCCEVCVVVSVVDIFCAAWFRRCCRLFDSNLSWCFMYVRCIVASSNSQKNALTDAWYLPYRQGVHRFRKVMEFKIHRFGFRKLRNEARVPWKVLKSCGKWNSGAAFFYPCACFFLLFHIIIVHCQIQLHVLFGIKLPDAFFARLTVYSIVSSNMFAFCTQGNEHIHL